MLLRKSACKHTRSTSIFKRIYQILSETGHLTPDICPKKQRLGCCFRTGIAKFSGLRREISESAYQELYKAPKPMPFEKDLPVMLRPILTLASMFLALSAGLAHAIDTGDDASNAYAPSDTALTPDQSDEVAALMSVARPVSMSSGVRQLMDLCAISLMTSIVHRRQ